MSHFVGRRARRACATHAAYDARVLSPVLLVGAGTREATCGILYLASYLRRHGVEAFVRLWDGDDTEADVERTLAALLAHVKPKLVGISLKWFHHLSRARVVAQTIKRLDPSVRVVLGGNSAAWWWKELAGWSFVDHVVLGDGEAPLLALCREDPEPPNVVTRRADGTPDRKPLGYVQGVASEDVYYSHFDQLFLSGLDASCFSGWVAPGKGCGENCLYCGGSRGIQKASFGRAKPFLRPDEAVQRDHREIVPRTWQLRYDFSGSSGAFLERAWGGLDLSKHATTYFLWGVPPKDLVQTLARHFGRVFMVLDIGCFSEKQRLGLIKLGLLKPCPTDAELFDVIADCRRYPNLELEISGIAALPYASAETLAEEKRLITRLVRDGCTIGYQRLESQPGALVTEHPARFHMRSEATRFDEFLRFFDARGPAVGEGAVPMLRFTDAKLERAVQRTFEELDGMIAEAGERKRHVALTPGTKLKDVSAERREVELGAWLGTFRVPAKVAKEKVTIVRSLDGVGLSCAPSLSARRFEDPSLQQGEEGAAVLAVLDAFATPKTVDEAVTALRKRRVPDEVSHELIDHLVATRFLAR